LSFLAVAFHGLLHLSGAVLRLENNMTIVQDRQAATDPRRWEVDRGDIALHLRGDDPPHVIMAGQVQLGEKIDTVGGRGRDRAPPGVLRDVPDPGPTPLALLLGPHHRDEAVAIDPATPLLHDEAVGEDVEVLVTAATTVTAIEAEAHAVGMEGIEVIVHAAMVATGGKSLFSKVHDCSDRWIYATSSRETPATTTGRAITWISN
jgi:hypothetical protein